MATKAKPKDKIVKITLSNDEQANANLRQGRLEEYTVPGNELDIVHAEIEKVSIDARSGKKKSVPAVQKFDLRAWRLFRKNAYNLGYNHVRVLHAPASVKGDDLKIAVPQPKAEPKK